MPDSQNVPTYYCEDNGLNLSRCSLCGKQIQGPSRYSLESWDKAEKEHTTQFHADTTCYEVTQ